jgi:hypothetical protein
VVLDTIASWVFGGAGQAGLAIALLAVVLYWRRALGLGRLLSTWGGRVVFAAATLGVLLLLGIVPTLDLGRASALAGEAWAAVREVWPTVRAWLEGVL